MTVTDGNSQQESPAEQGRSEDSGDKKRYKELGSALFDAITTKDIAAITKLLSEGANPNFIAIMASHYSKLLAFITTSRLRDYSLLQVHLSIHGEASDI